MNIFSGFQRPFKHTSRYKIRNGPLKERYKGILDQEWRPNKLKGWWIFHNQVPQWAKQAYKQRYYFSITFFDVSSKQNFIKKYKPSLNIGVWVISITIRYNIKLVFGAEKMPPIKWIWKLLFIVSYCNFSF